MTSRDHVLRTDTLKEEVYSTLTRGYRWLFSTARTGGHWGEVRSTALAGMCLTHREPRSSRWLEGVRAWLESQQTEMHAESPCWGEELWDTSMALIALSWLEIPPGDPVVQRAVRWQLSLFDRNGNGNWHDEPWETSWTILSLLEAGGGWVGREEALQGFRWLMGLQDESGRIIAPHYTAYFLKIYAKLKAELEDVSPFDQAERLAVGYLLASLDSRRLWTGEAWSNGQILWSLLGVARIDELDSAMVRSLTSWFSDNQEEDGSWSQDVEDTASSILGLYQLALALESLTASNSSQVQNLVYDTLRRMLDTPEFVSVRRRWERRNDGTLSLNFFPQDRKRAGAALVVVSTISLIITFWDQLRDLFRALWGLVT